MGMSSRDVLFDITYKLYNSSKRQFKFPEFKLEVVKELNKQKIKFDEDSIGYDIAEILDEIDRNSDTSNSLYNLKDNCKKEDIQILTVENNKVCSLKKEIN